MDEVTLRERAEAWRLRAMQTPERHKRASSLQIAEHYEALADLMARRPGLTGRGEREA